MAYDYITNRNSPNFTPADKTASVWGVNRQIRNIAIHWWGDPAQNPQFEGVVNHLCDPASSVSAHYVATGTNRQVACLVSPNDNSWSTMSDNPYCISIECDPRCRDEDYDVVAEVVADIRSAYGNLPLVPHRQFTATSCPGNWDLARIDRIASTKVSQAEWGQVTTNTPPIAPTPAPVIAPPVVEPVPTPAPTPVVEPVVPTPVPVVVPPVISVPVVAPIAPTPVAPVVKKQSAFSYLIYVIVQSIINLFKRSK
jgi:N-acetylmuramoyl-L-alanine amidase